MNAGWFFIIPATYTLYAFGRLLIDRWFADAVIERLLKQRPDLAGKFDDPRGFGGFSWLFGPPKLLQIEVPELTEALDEITKRIRAWSFRRMPVAVVLTVVCGVWLEYQKGGAEAGRERAPIIEKQRNGEAGEARKAE